MPPFGAVGVMRPMSNPRESAGTMSIRKLVIAAVVSVLLAASAIVVIAVVVQPASPKPTDTQQPVAKVSAPAGTTAGTTPTSTGMVFVAASTSSGNVLSELSTREGTVTHAMTLEGT